MDKTEASLEQVISGLKMYLLPEKAVWIPDKKALLLSDLHLGKVDHFRKNGLAVPHAAGKSDLDLLSLLIARYDVQHCFLLGDLFHSEYNAEWERFAAWASGQDAVLYLVEGNHDILSKEQYSACGLKIFSHLELDNILLSHEPLDEIPSGFFNIAGHIHPGIRLFGKGRQSLRLPCFFKQPQLLILPAFGSFTGLYVVSPKEKDEVFAIAGGRVVKVF